MSTASKNTEVAQTIALARQLRNSLVLQETLQENTRISKDQVSLVQDLNSTLLALQLVALEGVEQSDPVISKKALLNILDIAESFASKLNSAILEHSVLLLNNKSIEDSNDVKAGETTTENDTMHRLIDQSSIDDYGKMADGKISDFFENVESTGFLSKEEVDNIVEPSEDAIMSQITMNDQTIKNTERVSETAVRSDIIESLLMETAKTIIIPIVGDVLKEEALNDNVLKHSGNEELDSEKIIKCSQDLEETFSSHKLTGKLYLLILHNIPA